MWKNDHFQDHHLLCFRDQYLSDEQLTAFSVQFGPLEIYPEEDLTKGAMEVYHVANVSQSGEHLPEDDRMVVFQETALMPWLTSYQNVIFGPKLRGDMKDEDIEAEANAILEKVGLGEFKDKFPLQLSGGMQRRAELARAMINNPLLMIMDEPFRGLDAMSRELMQKFFVRLFEENRRTNLFVTSEIEEAIFLADHLVVLSNRPTSVRKIIDIKLPRPREFSLLSSTEAYDYKREAMELLHEEAMKSFENTQVSAAKMDPGMQDVK